MKLFKNTSQDEGAYREALIAVLHDPFWTRMVEVNWLGTERYLQCVHRDGIPLHSQFLADLRARIGKTQDAIAAVDRDIAAGKRRIDELRQARQNLFSTGSGAYEWEPRVRNMDARIKATLDKITEQTRLAKECSENLGYLRRTEERLEAALLYAMDHPAPAQRSEPPPPPVVNVTVAVEPTPITMEATINTPPAEVTVSLPPRKTETSIERDANGNISHAYQVESDA